MSDKNHPTYDKRAIEVSDYLQQLDPIAQVAIEPANDAMQSSLLHSQSLGRHGRICWGRVITALPFVNWYRVMLDDGDGDLPCCKASGDTTLGPMGPKDAAMIAPNSMVLVFKHNTGFHGFILASVPDIVQDGDQSFSDAISQGSAVGFLREGYLGEALTLVDDEGGVSNFAADRPFDATCLDWGKITELGGRIHIDPFMMQFVMDETCGLELFYHDQLARLSGYNLDIRSAGHELTVRDDEGEIQYCHGESLYPWEAKGALKPDAEVHREEEDTDVLFEKSVGKYEPKANDQVAFRRYKEWGGYLGQGRMREMSAPPDGDLYQMTDDTAIDAVFREQVLPTGAFSLVSAKSVVIAKRAAMVSPHRKKAPEDYGEDDADNTTNYKASGQEGDGDDHKVGDIAIDGELSQLKSAAAVVDLQSYMINWQSMVGFHYHKKDYFLPEESELTLDQVSEDRKFGDLSSKQWLDRPVAHKLKIDHRYGEVDYFNVLSHISMTDDGNVVIAGGGGEEIILGGGSIRLSCPGDIIFQPGRSVVALGGDDIVLRARNSIDISTADKDIRIKAQKNFQALAGNGGSGAMLFESKSSGTTHTYEGKIGEDVEGTGIVFKAATGQFAVLASNIYLRTGSTDGQISGGPITIDADKGQQRFTVIAAEIQHFVENQIIDTFGITTRHAVNTVNKDEAVFSGRVDVNGQLAVNGNGVFIKGNVAIAGGHISSEYSAQYNGKVGDLTRNPASLAQVNSRLQGIQSDQTAATEKQNTHYTTHIQTEYYDANKIGNGDLEKSLAFSYRNEEQYNTTEFALPETSWQRVVGNDGGSPTWTESTVDYQGNELMPWPGTKKWRDEENFYKLELKFFDVEEGRDKDREGDTYEEPKLNDWNKDKLDGVYPVI